MFTFIFYKTGTYLSNHYCKNATVRLEGACLNVNIIVKKGIKSRILKPLILSITQQPLNMLTYAIF